MSESILKRLKDQGVYGEIYARDDGLFLLWDCEGYNTFSLTRAELIQLADEIRELAGEDFDHG